MAASSRLLLVGWDGAEWDLISPLLDAGKLPNLARLVEAGITAKLGSLSPVLSAPLWTTVATGRRPEDHGICGNLEPSDAGVAPISSRMRCGLPLWEIAVRAGRPAVVVDWPASLPCAERSGLVVASGNSARPLRLQEDVAELRVKPSEFERNDLRPFVHGIEALDPAREPPLAALMSELAGAAGTHAVATCLLENEPWDLAMVNYSAIGAISRGFIDCMAPRLPQVPPDEFARYEKVMAETLALHDQMLGRLLAFAGRGCSVLLCSNHGWLTGRRRPALEPGEHAFNIARERAQGWAVLRAPGVKADELLYGGALLDLAPTVLWLLNLPVPKDWRGKVWYHTMARPAAATAIETHESAPLPVPRLPEPTSEAASDLRYQHACYLLGAGRIADAIPLLEEARRTFPGRIGPGLHLLNAYMGKRRLADARVLLDEITARPDGGLKRRPGLKAKHPPQFDFMRGFIAQEEGSLDEARRHFEMALAGGAQTAEMHIALGRLHLAKQQWSDARAAFSRGLEIDPESTAAHHGLAAACYRLRDFPTAADHAMEAASRRTEPAEFHLLLGMALARIGQREQAVVALRNALARHPALLLAHRVLVILHKRNPAESVLVETHRRAVSEILLRLESSRRR